MAADATPPGRFAEYRDRHRGAAVIVCGCGASLSLLEHPDRFVTIGVNDVGRRFTPDYLVVVNEPRQFDRERYVHVEQSQAKAVFTQLDLPHPRVVRFRLGQRGGTDRADPERLHYTGNSPYVAVDLARHLGARRIGLIGVDFTDDHFFAHTGAHPLARQLARIDEEYKRLGAACERAGIEICNLSPISRLTAFARITLAEFSRRAGGLAGEPAASGVEAASGWRIVSYATTPVAGVPAILARSIAARTTHRARCVWAQRRYGNGVSFDGDLEWAERPAEAEAALAEADAVIVHNGKVDSRHATLIRGKPVVVMAHNYLWNVDQTLVRQGYPGVVVGQYAATLPEFAGWPIAPNPIPFWEPAFQPEAKEDIVTIAYTPSGRHESYPEGHRLYWHGKGYATTMRILDNLSRRYPIRIEAIRNRQLSHAEALAAKRRAHIVIDECVTGSYHRNSLEGLACGCVVVNGVGSRAGVADALRRCAGGAADVPFVQASRDTLEPVLRRLVESGPSALAAAGRRNRAWLETHWDFALQWPQFWQPAIERAVEHHARKGGSAMSPRKSPASGSALAVHRPQLSIVIPHSGADRLPLLRHAVRALATELPEAELIVAEMGPTPLAAAIAREVGAIHILIASKDVFERARALNAGSAVASHDIIVWQDNDLLCAPGFFARAVDELEARRLDCLIPYTQISYLSAADTAPVLRGTTAPADCRPVRTLRSGHDASGGMGIVRRKFFESFGGFSQEFRGWGGEDNFWWKKATLLGRAGTTQRNDQQLWHLFHDSCGALTGRLPLESPHYHRNVALLAEARRLSSAAQFCARFPSSRDEYCPFDAALGLRILAAPGTPSWDFATAVAAVLGELYRLPMSVEDASSAADGRDCSAVATFGSAALGHWAGRALPGGRASLHHVARGEELEPPPPSGPGPGRCPVITDASPEQVASFGFGGPVYSWAGPRSTGSGARRAAVALVQALSHSLTGSAATAATPAPMRAGTELPVWLYWEGELPRWIERCHATILTHAPDARLLDRAEFELIWDRDRDIDIGRLVPAQRADFIRAFLLWRHGGIWIDSDCLLMRDLKEVHSLLEQSDFVAHRDRQDLFPNGFMGAAPGSRVAAELYRRVCERLRSGQPLGWISLGGEPLTRILQTTPANWHELPCERIQPICWSAPEAFFQTAEATIHEARVDPRAITYMLSQTKITEYQRQHPEKNLLSEGTFFRFLLARSIQGRQLPPAATGDRDEALKRHDMFAKYHRAAVLRRDESLSGPGSSTMQTGTLRRTLPGILRRLGIRSLLDAGCGDFNWMRQVDLGLERYLGVDIIEELITRNRRRYAAPRREFLCMDLASGDLPAADAVLCRDTLVHYPLADALRIIGNLKRSGARYLLATTFPGRGTNSDIPLGGWRPLDMQAAPFNFTPPLDLIKEDCTEMGGRYADKSLATWELRQLAS